MKSVPIAACAAMTLFALAACSGGGEALPTASGLAPISGGGIHAATYRDLTNTTAILATSKVITVGQGCLAVDWEGEKEGRILALPEGSSISSTGVVTTPNMKPFTTGDTIKFTGTKYGTYGPTNVTAPPECPTGLDIWYLVPLTGLPAPSPTSSSAG